MRLVGQDAYLCFFCKFSPVVSSCMSSCTSNGSLVFLPNMKLGV